MQAHASTCKHTHAWHRFEPNAFGQAAKGSNHRRNHGDGSSPALRRARRLSDSRSGPAPVSATRDPAGVAARRRPATRAAPRPRPCSRVAGTSQPPPQHTHTPPPPPSPDRSTTAGGGVGGGRRRGGASPLEPSPCAVPEPLRSPSLPTPAEPARPPAGPRKRRESISDSDRCVREGRCAPPPRERRVHTRTLRPPAGISA